MRHRPRLLRAAPLCFVLMVSACPARGSEGLYLSWNDCVLAPGAAHDLATACDSDLGSQTLYCAFSLSAPTDSVLGVEVVVDLQHADATLPDWWQLGATGCRAGCLVAGFDFTGLSSCTDFLRGNAAGGLQGYYVGEPRGGAGQARIQMAASVLPAVGGYAQLDSDSTYYAAALRITNARTTGATACAGCAGSACLVLNSVTVRRQPGVVGGDVVVSAPAGGTDNQATWQGGGADCTAVPVRATTWGRLKALYR